MFDKKFYYITFLIIFLIILLFIIQVNLYGFNEKYTYCPNKSVGTQDWCYEIRKNCREVSSSVYDCN